MESACKMFPAKANTRWMQSGEKVEGNGGEKGESPEEDIMGRKKTFPASPYINLCFQVCFWYIKPNGWQHSGMWNSYYNKTVLRRETPLGTAETKGSKHFLKVSKVLFLPAVLQLVSLIHPTSHRRRRQRWCWETPDSNTQTQTSTQHPEESQGGRLRLSSRGNKLHSKCRRVKETVCTPKTLLTRSNSN